jgi:creatinine amidohydrolase
LINQEVEDYLDRNDLIFVGVGTVEMHGGLPLDCETVLAEAFALEMAEAADGLVLSGLPYFFPGGTVIGRGTVHVSIREGIDYLLAIARSLLRQGFRRQVYLTFHGPAEHTCNAFVRDFFTETRVPILYLDVAKVMMRDHRDWLAAGNFEMNDLFFGGYDMLHRLEDIPLTSSPKYDHSRVDRPRQQQSMSGGPLGGVVGFYYRKRSDHAPTPKVDTAQDRQERAERGKAMIRELVKRLDIPTIVARLREMDQLNQREILPEYGDWLPPLQHPWQQ